MSSTVEQIKERLSIQDVVGSYLKLLPAGKNLKAACPFHNEKTPSFFVSPERDSYYCFGCGAKGDIFTFVEEFEGVDFQGALKILAGRAGVQIVYDRAAVRREGEKERLFEVLEQSTEFFENNLKEDVAAMSYLLERGMGGNTIAAFRLGYARDEWRALYDHLVGRKYAEAELLAAGLVKRKESGTGYYDTFRGRIMFPIADSAGRIVAFSARVFPPVGENEAVGERGAKYLNSPETPLFRKSRILYGYDQAKSTMRKYDFCIVVEGTIDVIMSHQAGFRNTVAPLGTALTREHLESIKRFTGNIVLALDADSAGIASAGRGAELALATGFDVKVAKLPRETDPADVINKNPDDWRAAIRAAVHIVDFLVSVLKESASDERAFELAVRRTVLPYVARIENKIDQAHFVKRVAHLLGVKEETVYEEVRKASAGAPETSGAGEEETLRSGGERGDAVRETLGLLVWQQGLDKPDIDVAGTVAQLLELAEADTLETLMARYDGEELSFEAEREAERTVSPRRKAAELLTRLEIRQLERKRETAREGDIKTFQELSQRIDALKQSMRTDL
jgi:DNA primase